MVNKELLNPCCTLLLIAIASSKEFASRTYAIGAKVSFWTIPVLGDKPEISVGST